MNLGFKGKVALVTGAGSQIGFGHLIFCGSIWKILDL